MLRNYLLLRMKEDASCTPTMSPCAIHSSSSTRAAFHLWWTKVVFIFNQVACYNKVKVLLAKFKASKPFSHPSVRWLLCPSSACIFSHCAMTTKLHFFLQWRSAFPSVLTFAELNGCLLHHWSIISLSALNCQVCHHVKVWYTMVCLVI